MKITAENHSADGNVTVVKVDGYLDAHTFPELESELRGMVNRGCYYILLDFETLDYISSAGLGLLLGVHKLVVQENGGLKIANMSESMRRIFEVLGFSRIFDTRLDKASALEAFQSEM
jgi:anti-anti-sigma factor